MSCQYRLGAEALKTSENTVGLRRSKAPSKILIIPIGISNVTGEAKSGEMSRSFT